MWGITMSYNDRDLQAPWIGYPEDYWDEEETEYDEDFEYESWRDRELEKELYGK